MVVSVFPSYLLQQSALDAFAAALDKLRVFAPQVDNDGFCRLLPVCSPPLTGPALPTFIPLKKLLLPPREKIWSFQAGQFSAVEEPEPFAIVGVPLCDLQALWYLDQVFSDDTPYQKRRAQVLLVGMPCEAGSECHCDRQLMPIAGDIFLDQERAWALSTAGEALLQSCGCIDAAERPLPWPEAPAEKRQNLSEEQYQAAAQANVWEEEAQRCLSCGACSAVCPTCYCFDLLDEAVPGGTVTRNRTWDNCFFAEHGKVAGGHDFRAGRANRLRFRMEHKFFGFGTLRGQNSCVGCGRCRKVCPVDIDLEQIAVQLVEGSQS